MVAHSDRNDKMDSSRTASLIVVLSLMALLALGSLFAPLQPANATGFSNLRCSDALNHNVESASVEPGTMITCKTFSTNPANVKVHFWIDTPTGTIDDTHVKSYATGTTLAFTFPVDAAGQWEAHVNYFDLKGNVDVVVCKMFVNFMVLPETSLGALGIIGSSLAALGAFMILKKRKSEAYDA